MVIVHELFGKTYAIVNELCMENCVPLKDLVLLSLSLSLFWLETEW